MKNQNINPRERKNEEQVEKNSEGNVDGTSFGKSQNEDADQITDHEDSELNKNLEGGDYSKEGKTLDGRDFDTDESVG